MKVLHEEEYKDFHPQVLQPLDIKVDIDLFEQQMHEYRYAFRRWGAKHHNKPRYGAPLVNVNGEMFNNPEPVCYPLGQLNAGKPESEHIYDIHRTKPTEMLDATSFDPLAPLKPFMLRSCILKWDTGGMFYPHTDTCMPSEIIRLWGTNDPEHMQFRFDKDRKYASPDIVDDSDFELVEETGIEAGRLYIADTYVIHDAHATGDNVYQFFIALSPECMPVLKELICTE